MKTKLTFKATVTSAMLAFAVLFGFTNSFAQDEINIDGTSGSLDLVIGAKVGVNFNQFSQPLTTIGGSAGGFVRYQVLDFLEVQGELLYSLQGGGRMEYSRDYNLSSGSGSGSGGASYDGPIDYVQYVNRTVLLHVIGVPISARLGLPELNGGAIIPKLILGGSYSYNFAAGENNDKIFYFVNGTRGLVSDTYDNVTPNYFPHNFSLHAGIALDFNLADAKVFTMEFKYRQGLSNLNQVQTTITELTDKLYSSGFSINFAYRIF